MKPFTTIAIAVFGLICIGVAVGQNEKGSFPQQALAGSLFSAISK
jgi:hypothetical protein